MPGTEKGPDGSLFELLKHFFVALWAWQLFSNFYQRVHPNFRRSVIGHIFQLKEDPDHGQ